VRYALPAFLGAQEIRNLYLKGAQYYVAQNHVGEDGGLVQNLNTPRIPGVAFLLLQSQQGRTLADCVTLAQEAVDGNLADARELLATDGLGGAGGDMGSRLRNDPPYRVH
jgi:hypothetical protein